MDWITIIQKAIDEIDDALCGSTFTYDNDARAYNYGATFYKNNEKTKV